MLIENKGIKKDNYFIPPFVLNEGEIIILYLFEGQYFLPTELYLKDIFTGKIKHENVLVHKHLSFVEYIFEPRWRSLFCPITVGEYLRKNANTNSNYATKIYERNKWITNKTKIHNLAGNIRKQLSLFATLSKSKNIVFDLSGQDPLGAEETYECVKENVKNGGSGILIDWAKNMIDWAKNMEDKCTKLIQIQWTE
ncbi:MAG: hypothetical protein EAZ85_08120 [Bacteroidetes bacterium]|nr:MAG: hypothetical protein EAZ85_08120 [Bacteroidota bacterium]TAG94674.1 MAG: hypothetical protein EAZ20_00705 [Bacteroidota bacterium]